MRVMFVAGGTGGHINPAVAVANEIRRLDPSSQILFVGTEGRMETQIVPKAGFEIKTIFTETDVPRYHAYEPADCPMCRAGQRVEALVNSFGYSELK